MKLTHDYEFIEFLSGFINQLNHESQQGAVLVVEGKNDVQALISLGFTGNIIEYCNNNNLSKFSRQSRIYHKLILLFDYDHEGRRLTSKIIKTFERIFLIDTRYRRILSRASRGYIKNIEELSKFLPLVK